jgi:hypothetical protein
MWFSVIWKIRLPLLQKESWGILALVKIMTSIEDFDIFDSLLKGWLFSNSLILLSFYKLSGGTVIARY